MKMKKPISLICTCSMLLGVLALLFCTPAAAQATLNGDLITHWDFEGEGADALADKATGGAHNNIMQLQGNATAGGGVAYIPDENGSGIFSADDESGGGGVLNTELMRTTRNRTIYIRFQSDHAAFQSTSGNRIELISQNGAIRFGISSSNQAFGSTNPHSMGENYCKTDGMTYTQGRWITVAISYDKSAGNGKFTVSTHYLVDGGEWSSASVTYTDAAQTWTEDNSDAGKSDSNALIFGRLTQDLFNTRSGGNITIDDIRIYDRVLTATELESLAQLNTLDDSMLTHWDFSGSNPLADKITRAGTTPDTLISTSSTGQILQNGTITVKGADKATDLLYANDSPDLLRTAQSRSLAIRFRADSPDQLLELASQNSALRLFRQANATTLNASLSPDSMGANVIWSNNSFSFSSDTWYTVIIIFDKPSNTTLNLMMYLADGESGAIVAQKQVTDIDNSRFWTTDSSEDIAGHNGLYLGRRYNGGNPAVANIEIDDVRIYGRALSEDECTTVHQKMASGTPASDVAPVRHSLSLGGDIGVNFYVTPSAYLVGNGDVSVTVSGGSETLVDASFSEAYKTADLVGAYRFTAHISAKEMTEPLTLTVKHGDRVCYTEVYSARSYADVLLADPSKYEKELPLLKAMLNYGGYAQVYFGYRTEQPANAGFSLALGDVSLDDSHQFELVGDSIGGVHVKATLKLEEKTQVVFTVQFDEAVALSDYRINGEVPSARSVTVISEGVNAQALHLKQELKISCGNLTQCIYYAPTTYIKNCVNAEDAALRDLLKALYAYYEAAKLYNGSQSVKDFGIISYTAGEGLLYNGIKLPDTLQAADPNSDAVVTPLYLLSASEGGYRPEVIDITVGRQLFVDDFLIADTDLTTVYHQAEKHGEPIYQENGRNVGTSAGGVWYDMQDQKFKMWYDINFNPMLGYLESDDGINWTRVDVNGSGSNVVMGVEQKNGTCSVFIDYEAPAAERYKMFVQQIADTSGNDTSVLGKEDYDRLPGDVDEHGYRHTLYVSADGVNWTQKGGSSVGVSGDLTTAFYNAFTHEWVNSLRGYARTYYQGSYYTGRARWYAASDSFEGLLNWTTEDAVFWMKCDGEDQISESGCVPQLYNFGAIAYESVMLGSYTVWYGPENHTIEQTGEPKKNEIQMTYSRDGYYYDRPDRTAFIGVGDDGDWDKGYLFASIGGIIVKDDLLYIYYSGFSGYDAAGNKNAHMTQSIGLATIRRDGFASLEGKGTVTTRTLTANEGKKYLFVNVDVPADSFRAEVLDANGNAVEGFTMEDCVAVGGDNTCLQITWKNGRDLSFLNGTEFSLRFSMEQEGAFYSFWLSDCLTGESGGAVAAGYAGN